MPGDWWLGKVLWTGEKDCLVERSDMTGRERWREVVDYDHIRAIGDIHHLTAFQHEARLAVKDRQRLVHARESALGAARDLVWKKLDEIGAGVPVYRPTEAEDA